jgi:photosystem II stability/assembly factor-like uncharacterized protein
MKTKLLTAIIFFTLFINGTKAQWNVIGGSSTMAAAQTIYFIDASTGFEGGTTQIPGGNSIISKTTNGGGSWTTVYTHANDVVLSIYFVNSTKGFAGTQQLLLKTTDGGNSWQPIAGLPIASVVSAIHFADANTGYAAGSDVIYKTTDGGTTWDTLPIIQGFTGVIRDIHFTDPATGFLVAYNGYVYHTDDGGNTWDTTGTGATALHSIHFIDANTGYTVGASGKIFKTTNGGVSWVQQNSSVTDNLFDIKFINSTTGFACGGSKIIRTINGGANWTVNASMPASFFSFYTMSFPTATTGYATGLGGINVAKTTNAGGVGIEELNPLEDVIISSNPTETEFTVMYDGFKKNMLISIYNLTGEIITELAWISDNEKKINVKNLPSGIYFVMVHDGKNSVVRKLVKM